MGTSRSARDDEALDSLYWGDGESPWQLSINQLDLGRAYQSGCPFEGSVRPNAPGGDVVTLCRQNGPQKKKPHDPFRWFDSSPEVTMYVRFPLSLRNVEDLLFGRGVDIRHETVRLWWNRFAPMFAAEIRRKRVQRMRQFTHWRWRLDEV